MCGIDRHSFQFPESRSSCPVFYWNRDTIRRSNYNNNSPFWFMTNLVILSKSQFSIIFKSGLIAAIVYVALGTVTALWDNPFFFRMTPTSGFEIILLSLQAIMFGACPKLSGCDRNYIDRSSLVPETKEAPNVK